MINLTWLREDTERVIVLTHKKDPEYPIKKLFDLDKSVRSMRAEVETLRKEKNDVASAGRAGVTEELRARSTAITTRLKDLEAALDIVEKEFHDLYLRCPNIISEDVPAGNKAQNVPVSVVGEKPTFDFPIKNHLELGERLGWFDFAAGAKITGSQFPVYKGTGAKLLYALTRFMIDNNQHHGYDLVLPPAVINETSLITASNFPKFRDQVYAVTADDLYLSPTAEVPLTNLYRDHIFSDELPIRMTAWTSCFRREAGAYGATERGLIRIHQFEKVEIYTICEPDQAQEEHARMVSCAESLLKKLGLHYRISLLAAEDCSFASATTYDIEVWLPGQNAYYEVSSSSNCTDFQARRGSIRYKKAGMKKPELAYTLNTSSLAVPRLMVAILESFQQADGSVIIPHVLDKYMF